MKMKIYYSDCILEITLKDIYTKEIINETLENSVALTLTESNGKDIFLNLQNIVAIEME